jgi:RNA polymerase sigma-70 factor (ECF subfamily)
MMKTAGEHQCMTKTEPIWSEPIADDDPSIVRRVAAGDRSAFELLMRRYNRRLYRLARAALRDPTEAEDALQEAYLSAYRLMGQFRGEAALSSWLSRLVLNECLGRLRRSARRHNLVPIMSSDSEIDINGMASRDSDLPDKVLGRAQMRMLLEQKLDALPESFRVVFVLRSVEELSVEDTAQSLGIPEETVRSRHFRARSLLRESLAQELDLAERDVFEFGGAHCDRIVAKVLTRLTP